MGTYLSTPVLDKCWEEGEDFENETQVAWGVVDMQGWRKTMEDAHIVQTDVPSPQQIGGKGDSSSGSPAQMFAVFDGHGGAEVARFCQLYMVDLLTRQKEWGNDEEVDVGKALVNCFHVMDDLLRDPSRRDEIQALKSIKPNYAERRSLEETMAQAITTGSEDEEKKIEETEMADSAAETKPLENDNNKNTEEADSVDSAASDEVIKEIVSIDDENMTNESENNDANVDTSSADSVSLFSRFLTITNKNGATSGTITLGEDDIDDENTDDDENQVIIPTIIQNGRPVCNLPDHPIHAGCTSVCAVVHDKTLTVANAGDSRVVLCRTDGVTVPMSFDHKPAHEIEMQRITTAGGFVNQFGRVNGNLNLSRSIGDLKYKQVTHLPPAAQMITAEPDIKQVKLKDDDEFIILACDGIWDCLTNEQAVKFVLERINTSTPTEIGVEMLDKIVSKDPRETQGIGGDNMTVMIVDLLPHTRSYRDNVSPEIDVKSSE